MLKLNFCRSYLTFDDPKHISLDECKQYAFINVG